MNLCLSLLSIHLFAVAHLMFPYSLLIDFILEILKFIEMDNRGEVSQILNGITFDRNNIS